MLGTMKKPSLKRRPDSGTPITNKKLKTSVESQKSGPTKPEVTGVKVKSKKHGIKSKSENDLKGKKLGLKSKPVFANLAKNKKSSKTPKLVTGKAANTTAGTDAKPNWVEIKQEKKEQKVARKEKKHGLEVYELSVKAKALWEKLRTKSTPQEKREEICQELFQLVKNDVGMLIHSHDLARVIQSLMKYGTHDMHTHIGDKLRQCFLKAATSKYGRFCVKASLKKCSAKSRNDLVQSALGNVVKLFCHKFGNAIVEEIYTVWAHGPTKRAMKMEFYGDLGKLLSIPPERKHMLDDLPDDLKPAILSATKLNLNKVLDKKHLFKSVLLHGVLVDFLRACDKQDREEVLEAIHSEIESLLTSSAGQKVAIMALWHGTNKMKKVAVKSIKGKVNQFAKSEFGHSFIMAMFDSIDDTVLINKVIVPELLADLEAILKNEYGRRVVLYLVAHRDPAYFHPLQLKMLRQGDAVRNSKKDDKLRLEELLAVVSETILKNICTDPALWCRDRSTAMVMLAVFKSAQAGDVLDAAYKALVDYILDPESIVQVNEPSPSQVHVTEECGVHMALKKLMIHEKEKSDLGLNTFAKCLVDNLTDEKLCLLLQRNRGAFTLVLVMENGDTKTIKKLKSKINSVIGTLDKKFKRLIGIKVLFKKLENEIK